MRLRCAQGRADQRARRGVVLLQLMEMTSRPTVLASIVLALALLGDSLLYAVLPLHRSTFGLSLMWVGVLLSANRIVRLLVYPFLPRIAAAGLRRFTIVAAATGAISTLTFAFASGGWLLLASRVAWGAAFGSLSLSALAYATASSEAAGKRVGLSLSLRELGPLLTVTSGTAAVASFGVRPALAALGMVSIIGVLIAAFLPDLRVKNEEGRGTAFRMGSAEWQSFFAGFVTDGIFPATVGLLIGRSAKVSEAVIGAGLLLGFKRIAVVVVAPVGGYAADRLGGRIVTAAGFVIAAVGAFFIACDDTVIGAVLLSCGAAVTTTSIPVSVAARDAERRVSALAHVGMARDAGAAAGPLVAFMLFTSVGAAGTYSAAGVLLALIGLRLSRTSAIGRVSMAPVESPPR
jgi:MFS transporter, DHA1 family, inner membrane transport protein